MNRVTPIFVLAATLGLAVAGCVSRQQTMPALDLGCTVYDVASDKPLPGAEVFVTYTGANGNSVTRGPFVTDAVGRTRIVVAAEVISVPGTDAYFAGGYLRAVTAQATGYEPRTLDEGFSSGLIEASAPLVFRLRTAGTPPRGQAPDDSVTKSNELRDHWHQTHPPR